MKVFPWVDALVSFAAIAIMSCAPGCGSEDASASEPPESIGHSAMGGRAATTTIEQSRSYGALVSETQTQWRWLQHERFGTPAHLSTIGPGPTLLTGNASPEAATISFLEQYRDLFKMRHPRLELGPAKIAIDELAMTHVRFRQRAHGVPLVGAELSAHYDRDGRLRSIDATYVPDLDAIDVTPRIDARARLARLIAETIATSGLPPSSVQAPHAPKLVVYARDPERAPKLAYELTIRAFGGQRPAVWVTTVDAITGAVLHRYDALMHLAASGKDVLGKVRKLEVSADGDGFVMADTSRAATLRTRTARNQEAEGPLVRSGSKTSWDTGVVGAGAAVNAHAYAALTADYYEKKHAWSGQDGKGAEIVTTVHYGDAMDDAFFDTEQGGGAFFGDGNELSRPASVDFDTVAHELTHGVTFFTSNLVYENESGALNESVSDVFGMFVKHFSAGADPATEWLFATDSPVGGGFLRNLKDPTVDGAQPAHVSKQLVPRADDDDNGGVHTNSGIPNNAAFLMTMGGRNPTSKVEVKFGIGWEKSAKLWFRANTRYFQEDTNFAAAARQMMQAGKDIGLTQNEKNIVECAWKAVGVVPGPCAEIVDPSPPPPASPDDVDEGHSTTSSAKSRGGAGSEAEPAEKPPSKSTNEPALSTDGCATGARDPGSFAPAALLALLTLLRRRRATRARMG